MKRLRSGLEQSKYNGAQSEARATQAEAALEETTRALERIVGWIERENDSKDLRLRDIADLARAALKSTHKSEGTE